MNTLEEDIVDAYMKEKEVPFKKKVCKKYCKKVRLAAPACAAPLPHHHHTHHHYCPRALLLCPPHTHTPHTTTTARGGCLCGRVG